MLEVSRRVRSSMASEPLSSCTSWSRTDFSCATTREGREKRGGGALTKRELGKRQALKTNASSRRRSGGTAVEEERGAAAHASQESISLRRRR
jgi:hypothetical protein